MEKIPYISIVMRETLKTLNDMMMEVQILKNDVVIKTLPTVESKLHITAHTGNCIADGMWNGTDVFKIVIKSL